jgi:hypothetical protein
MVAPRKNYGGHKNYCNLYYSTRLNGDEHKYHHEHSPLGNRYYSACLNGDERKYRHEHSPLGNRYYSARLNGDERKYHREHSPLSNRYYSARLNGDERMYRREHSPLSCDAVHSFWQPEEGLSKHCNRRHKKSLRYWDNHSGGGHNPQRSFQREYPCIQPTKVDTEKAEAYRGRVTISTSTDKRKQRDLHVIKLKNNMFKRFWPKKAASYGYKRKRVEPEPNTAAASMVASGGVRIAANDLRLQILYKRDYRKSKAGAESRVMTLKQRQHKEYHCSSKEETGVTMNTRRYISDGAVSAKEFKNGYKIAHDSTTSEAVFQIRQTKLESYYSFKEHRDTSEAVFQPRQKRLESDYSFKEHRATSEAVFQPRRKSLESDYSFKEHRVVSSSEVTLMLNGKSDSKNNNDTSTEPVRVGHTQIKTSAEIRAGNNSPVDSISRCSIPKKTPRVPDCLPQKLACKIIETQDNFRNSSDSNNFWVPASNLDEKDCLQKTKETMPDSKFTPRRRQLKRENKGPAGGPAPKGHRLIQITFNSLEKSEVIVQTHGNNTNKACSDLSQTKGTSCLSTKSANCVLNEKGDNNSLNPLSVSQNGKDGIDIFEEILKWDDEDNDILTLCTDEDILGDIDDIY